MEIVWIEKLAIQELCSAIARQSMLRIRTDGRDAFLPEGAFEFDGHVVRGYAALREYADAHTRVLRGRLGRSATVDRQKGAPTSPKQPGARKPRQPDSPRSRTGSSNPSNFGTDVCPRKPRT